jgi:peptidoglycan/xylan/chitin deacetylase (PgdA/CDA1 family)
MNLRCILLFFALCFPVMVTAESWQTNDFRRLVIQADSNGIPATREFWLAAPPTGGKGLLLFPGGRPRALTLSYDDDTPANRKLVEVINRYHLKATFNLNSGFLGEPNITPDEVKTLFVGHEVACHTVQHITLWNATDDQAVEGILYDRLALEKMAGSPIRGMAYPNGGVKPNAAQLFPALGIEYARGISENGSFTVIRNPYDWVATCHHSNMLVHAEAFVKTPDTPALFYVWGHAYEFDVSGNWDLLEQFGKRMSGRRDVWYATHMAVYDYLNAARKLEFSADGRIVKNPSNFMIWLRSSKGTVKIPPHGLLTTFSPPGDA